MHKYSTALAFATGKLPGKPKQIGHTFVFGGAPNALRHAQNILLAVSSSTCTSRPITASVAATSLIAVSLMPPLPK